MLPKSRLLSTASFTIVVLVDGGVGKVKLFFILVFLRMIRSQNYPNCLMLSMAYSPDYIVFTAGQKRLISPG